MKIKQTPRRELGIYTDSGQLFATATRVRGSDKGLYRVVSVAGFVWYASAWSELV
jgi:hypothetical protein